MTRTASNVLPSTLISPGKAGETASPGVHRLTTALARGDDEAWQEFHRDHGPALFRKLLALTRGDHDLAQEALQRTYLRVARHVRPCESEIQFNAWLRTVARSALHDCWRRRQSFTALLFRRQQEPDLPEHEAVNEQLLAALDRAMAGLEDGDRALLEEKYFRGRDVRHVAEKLGISPKAVESRLTRARARLRRDLLANLPTHD